MLRNGLKVLGFLAVTLCSHAAGAVASAELYTGESYGYGRVEARVQYAAGDGVVSAFFSWKDKSEQAGVFWNELDFEKLGADCYMQTNPIYGLPPGNHEQKHSLMLDMCGAFHTYAYEWTPEAIVWLIDGVEIRRETGAMAQAFADNAPGGMQIHFNVWPGDATFGGNFSPAILPVHQYLDWVQFLKYEGGEFTLAWREDFAGATLPAGWLTGSWASPKNHSTHAPENVNFIDGYAVLSLTADDAKGPGGAMPGVSGGSGGSNGAAGSAAGGRAGVSGATSTGGSSAAGGSTVAAGSTGLAGSPSGAGGVPTGSGGSAAGSLNAARTDGGCSFTVPAQRSSLPWGAAAAVLALVLVRRRVTWGGACAHPGTTLALAAMRLPNTVSTFSVWRSQREMLDMVRGHSAVPDAERHAKAMVERKRKDFHYEFTTLRFRALSEHGAWEGRRGIVPSAT